MTNAKATKPAAETAKISIVEHAIQQHAKQRKAQERAAELKSKMEKLEAEKRKIREHEKAANRDQKLLRTTSETATGALMAIVLLEAATSAHDKSVSASIDNAIAQLASPAFVKLRELLSGKPLSISLFASHLLPNFSVQTAVEQGAEMAIGQNNTAETVADDAIAELNFDDGYLDDEASDDQQKNEAEIEEGT